MKRYIFAINRAIEIGLSRLTRREKAYIQAIVTAVFTAVVILLSVVNSPYMIQTVPSEAEPEEILADEEVELDVSEQALWGNNDAAEDIGNNGFPYGRVTEEGVQFTIKLAEGVGSATYQWQYSDDKENWQNC